MKAKEVEKIYLNPLLMEDGESICRQCTFERLSDSQSEYIRTDAFIEKAENYLRDKCQRFILTEKDIEDFVNYMKEE